MKYVLIVCILAAVLRILRSKLHLRANAESIDQVSPAALTAFSQSTEGKGLVYFWQPHCGSCMKMEPIVDQVEKEYPGTQVVTVNTTLPENREVHDNYDIHGTPTFVVLHKDRIVARNNGLFLDKRSFLTFLKSTK